MSADLQMRSARTPARPTRLTGLALTSASDKRRKYIPGGPGGGGRFSDSERVAPASRSDKSAEYPSPRRRRRLPVNRNNATISPPLPSPMTTMSRPRRERQPATLHQSTSADAAAAAQSDGYKPREERGWEEFHKDLDLDQDLAIYGAEEVDGPGKASQLGQHVSTAVSNGHAEGTGAGQASAAEMGRDNADDASLQPATPHKRKPGRPPRRTELMLSGLGSPPNPKVVPIPMHNPKERLTLNKPIFRRVDTFGSFEQDAMVHQNYVDRGMANAGYQESEVFFLQKRLIRHSDWFNENEPELALASKSSDGGAKTIVPSATLIRVEYDMDEQDERWLEAHNVLRAGQQAEAIKPAVFEIAMTLIEKAWHLLEKQIPKPSPKPPQTHRPRSSSAAAVNGEPVDDGEEQDAKCAVCDDGDAENSNAIVFCDGCDLAVHQECYGVPYIPEGQWLCRRCQLGGAGATACIFCPNVDGAFKQTTNSKWSHLLCAIWIPEVSLGNPSLMEPVQDVDKVPRPRWKLTCYICQQKMGACIQCSSRNCFTAFHVTCAKRAKLHLRMKNGPRDPVMLDPSMLHAYCHKHVPADWAEEYNVEDATSEAKAFYRSTLKGRQWADSQRSALSYDPPQPSIPVEEWALQGQFDGTMAGQKRKRGASQTQVWKLQSGAPIIPQAVFDSVEYSMSRFSLRKRKEFVAETCKYWTLKREARRGAALLKRLQLQLENFSSMEITRRDFAGMGAIGRPRLRRRIEFAEQLQHDMAAVKELCAQSLERERLKLQDVETLRGLVDTVYFPISPLLWPVLEKAITLDSKGIFIKGLRQIQYRLEERHYTSVAPFWRDLGAVLGPTLSLDSNDSGEVIITPDHQLDGVVPDPNEQKDVKERKKLARRVARAIQESLQAAKRKEDELSGKDHEPFPDFVEYWSSTQREYRSAAVSHTFDGSPSINGKRESVSAVAGAEEQQCQESAGALGNVATHHGSNGDVEIVSGLSQGPDDTDDMNLVEAPQLRLVNGDAKINGSKVEVPEVKADIEMTDAGPTDGDVLVPPLSNSGSTNPSTTHQEREPLTPPTSEREPPAGPLATGGVPWYLSEFEPVGTTVHEEDFLKGDLVELSDELSEVDSDFNAGQMQDHSRLLTPSAASKPATTRAKPRRKSRRNN